MRADNLDTSQVLLGLFPTARVVVGLLTLLNFAFAVPVFAQTAGADTLFDYPRTALEGTISARVTAPPDDCRRICIERSGCIGFDHTAQDNACRVFSSIGSARESPTATAGTRLLVEGYGPPTNPPEKDEDLSLDVQTELKRVGCYLGALDGIWGAGSIRAVRQFVKHSNVALDDEKPGPVMLGKLRDMEGRICPLVCDARHDVRGDRCVLKTCPSGQNLNSAGKCEQRPSVRKGKGRSALCSQYKGLYDRLTRNQQWINSYCIVARFQRDLRACRSVGSMLSDSQKISLYKYHFNCR